MSAFTVCVSMCICMWWWRLLCCSEWGASSSVIHPQAKAIKTLHAPHSSPLLLGPLLSSHKQWDWSEVGSAVCVCVCLCARTHVRWWDEWAGVGYVTAENHREQQRKLCRYSNAWNSRTFQWTKAVFLHALAHLLHIQSTLLFSVECCNVAVKAVVSWWDTDV